MEEDLFKEIIAYCRVKFNEIIYHRKKIDLATARTFQIFCDQLLKNTNFYISLSKCNNLQNINEDYTLNIGYPIELRTRQLNDAELELIKNNIKKAENRAREYFASNLLISKFLFIDYIYEKYNSDLLHYFYFVFYISNCEQILCIKMLADLFFFLNFKFRE